MTNSVDIAGTPRITDGDFDCILTVDMGAYEFQVLIIPHDCIVMPPLNLKSRGRLPVTILSTDDFDATAIDPASVQLAGAWPVKYMVKDVNRDGYPDLKLFFNMRELSINPDDPCIQMIAQDYSGEYMLGLPPVRIVPKR